MVKLPFARLLSQGNITVIGASAPPAFTRMDNATTGRLQVLVGRSGRNQGLLPLRGMAEQDFATHFMHEQAETACGTHRSQSNTHQERGTQSITNLAVEHAEGDRPC